MSECIYDIARDFIKLDKETLDKLSRLVAREGDWVDVPDWPPPINVREWVDFMVPWWLEQGHIDGHVVEGAGIRSAPGGFDPVDAWEVRLLPSMDDGACRRHAATYHEECHSHGEAIGVTIRAWSLWVGTPEDLVLRAALSGHIDAALQHGIDH